MVVRARLVASGRVQGVFYRATVKDIADGMHITGLARNLRNGSVEVVCECGDEDDFEEFIRRIDIKTEYGIYVEKLVIEEKELDEERRYTKFSIAY
ncbi:MAG: acylphosphatase [Candidatus Micrarchaeota archaeon]|nr:acylphosphatase [Candidatus Micrarchaeota archaeon]